MPITQARMLSLLAAAQDYQQAFQTIMEKAEHIRSYLLARQITPEQACEQYEKATLPLLLLQYPYDSPVVLRFESLHFAKEKKRNDRKAAKARENRLADSTGQPRPNRGDGRQYGYLGGPKEVQRQKHQITIEPSIAATAPLSSQLLTRQYKPQVLHEEPVQRVVIDPDAGIGEQELFEEESAVEHVLGTLDEETKRKIEQELEDQAAARELKEKYGIGE